MIHCSKKFIEYFEVNCVKCDKDTRMNYMDLVNIFNLYDIFMDLNVNDIFKHLMDSYEDLWKEQDFDKIDACIDAPEKITERQEHWNKDFNPVQCDSLGEFETYMGHEIAMQIKLAKDRKEKIAFILPVGPISRAMKHFSLPLSYSATAFLAFPIATAIISS